MHDNPYQSPPPPAKIPSGSREAVSYPSLGLMITSGIGVAVGVPSLLIDIYLLSAEVGRTESIAVRMVWGALLIVASAFVFFGALQMRNLRNYPIAMGAAIVAAIPCVGPCCLLGIPFGIWALVVLRQDEVQRDFTN